MSTIYLIYYDNGESYEDHNAYPVLAALTKERAQQILGELNDWVREAKRTCPDEPDYDKPDYEKAERRLQRYVNKLKPPYDINELIHMAVDSYRADAGLHLREVEVV